MKALATATRVSKLRAPRQWQPSRGDLVRGRAALVGELERPENLPVQEYAILAGKSTGALYKDNSSRSLPVWLSSSQAIVTATRIGVRRERTGAPPAVARHREPAPMLEIGVA